MVRKSRVDAGLVAIARKVREAYRGWRLRHRPLLRSVQPRSLVCFLPGLLAGIEDFLHRLPVEAVEEQKPELLPIGFHIRWGDIRLVELDL